MRNIRLIVSDLEGCITPNKGLPFDLEALWQMAKYNEEAAKTGKPKLTICTGRSQPYVEAMLNIIRGDMPAICENGAAIYVPKEDRTLLNPRIDQETIEIMEKVKKTINEKIIRGKLKAKIEPGKIICITLNPLDCPQDKLPDCVKDLYHLMNRELNNSPLITITHSASAVDITPAGIDKGTGLDFLAEITQIAPEEMLGIGDSAGDLAFLKKVGIASCPANATTDVKAVSSIIIEETNGQGVMKILGLVST